METIASSAEVTRMSHFVGIGLILGFLLPHTSTALMLINPLLCIIYKCYKENRLYYKNSWIVIIPLFLTLLINFPQGVSPKALISCIVILLYFFCFPIVGKIRIPNAYFYIILCVIIVSQLADVLGISPVVNFMDRFYPVSEEDALHYQYMKGEISTKNVLDFRLGGIYRNGNHTAKYLNFLLASFLILNKEQIIRRFIPFITLSFVGVLLTGSRTGFAIESLIIVIFVFIDKRVSVKWRYGVLFIAIASFVYLITIGSNQFRGFNLADTGSSDIKMKTFQYYLSTETSPLKLLFGYLDEYRFSSSNGLLSRFDSDYGYLVFQYGFIGFGAIILYYFSLFLRINKYGRIFAILLLWVLTSAVVTSYRAMFLFMLLFSLIYSNNKR